jgi:hypothetical protein
LFDSSDQLIFLNRFGQECGGAFLYGAVAMLSTRARGYDHDGNATRRRALAELNHELVSRHTRHFEVGDDKMAAVLRDQFGGFETIGG